MSSVLNHAHCSSGLSSILLTSVNPGLQFEWFIFDTLHFLEPCQVTKWLALPGVELCSKVSLCVASKQFQCLR
jgi:hypothetical protein